MNKEKVEMKAFIYWVCKKLYHRHWLPWKIWSPVYDKWHRIGEA